MASLFDRLSDELIVLILSFCETTDLQSASKTSLRFQRIVGDDLLWRRVFERKWRSAWPVPMGRLMADSWREEYIERQHLSRAWQSAVAPPHRVYPGIGSIDTMCFDVDHRGCPSFVVASCVGGEAHRLTASGRATRRSTPFWTAATNPSIVNQNGGVSAAASTASVGHGAILCGSGDGRVRVVRLVEGGDRVRIPNRVSAAGTRAHSGRVTCSVLLGPDWGLAGGADGRVSVWQLSSPDAPVGFAVAGRAAGGPVLAVAGVAGVAVAAVHMTADGREGGLLRTWDWGCWDEPRSVVILPATPTSHLGLCAVPAAPFGSLAIVAHGLCGRDDAACVWWTDTNGALLSREMPTARCMSAASVGGIAVGCGSGGVALLAPWLVRGVDEVRPRGHRAAVGAIHLDSFKAVSACAENVRVWDRLTLDCLRKISLGGSLADAPARILAVGPLTVALVDGAHRALAVRTWDLTAWVNQVARGESTVQTAESSPWASAQASARSRRRSGGRRHSGGGDGTRDDAYADAEHGCREWVDMEDDLAREDAERARLARRYNVDGLTEQEALQLALAESMGAATLAVGAGVSKDDYVSAEEERQLLWALAASQLEG